MALSINLRTFAKSNQMANRLLTKTVARLTSSSSNVLIYEKDPTKIFFSPDTQRLLKSITRLQLDKVFRKRAVPDNAVEYKFMTTKQLEEEVRAKFLAAERLLQMPPVVQIKEEKKKVISTDPALSGFSDSSFVFTDVTFGLKNSDRSVVIRHQDGVLENASYDVRKRVYQIYFPMPGRKFRDQKMFDDQNLKRLFGSEEYEFVLDSLCMQFEPYEPKFHQITSQVYQHVSENDKFDLLRSTRHFGPMAFFFAWQKSIDNLVLDMIRNDFLKNAVEVICLMYKLNAIQADTSILNTLEALNEREMQIRKTIDALISKVDSSITKIEKTSEDLKLDELCFEFIQESFVKQHSLKKAQLEMALQSYKERHNELKSLAQSDSSKSVANKATVMGSNQESFAVWLKSQQLAGESISSMKQIAKCELNRMLEFPGNTEPERGNLDEATIEWRNGKPNYTLANLAYLKGKCKYHEKGSLEMLVENAVKTWEVEASHKKKTDQWKTIVHKEYSVQANGGNVFKLEEAASKGNYNVLMDHVESDLYDAANEDFESSHVMFQTAFQHIFPWELLEVFVGPPRIVFSWRHWGEFTGEYKGNFGQGQLIKMNGFAQVTVTSDLKITSIKAFYKPEAFLRALRGETSSVKDDEKDQEEVEAIIMQWQKEVIEKRRECEVEVNGEKIDHRDTGLMKTFPWNVTEVFSKAPEMSFTWKSYNEGSKGFAIVFVDGESVFKSFRAFYKPAKPST